MSKVNDIRRQLRIARYEEGAKEMGCKLVDPEKYHQYMGYIVLLVIGVVLVSMFLGYMAGAGW